MNSVHFLQRDKKKKRAVLENKWGCSSLGFHFFRERMSTFSLDFWSIGPSVFDGARSKVVLRDEGYA